MKTTILFLFFSLLVTVCYSQNIQELIRQKTNASIENTTLKKNISNDNWYADARQYIREQEYYIKWNNDLQQPVAVNRQNHLGFYFNEQGYRTLSFATSGNNIDEWEYVFHFNEIRRGKEKLEYSQSATVDYSKDQLIYKYPEFAIEYINDANGMRQNFIIDKKISGSGKLNIEILLEGTLIPSIANGNQLILSSPENDGKKEQLRYDGLKAWDSNHQLLNATMELSENGKQLTLKIDDGQAVYPITVDPLNHTPYWTDNGQGVLPSLDVLYGSSVSEAGDVNSDGYGDLIIGAPGNINILSGTVIASVGQAFIYFGSATGLSASPSVTLQSSSTVNALFGFSVSSAGDINNDGYDDVIVGAPADKVTLNFGIPFGSITKIIGKAYVYYGNAVATTISGSVIAVNLTATDFLAATFGLTLNPLFGFSVSNAGDVNNDGYDDVIIGSPAYIDLGTLTLAGRAAIYLGSNSGLVTASPIYRNAGLLSNTLFGFSVSTAGDMNNDGADEVLIGAPGALSLLPGLTGVAYVYKGIAAPASGGIAVSPITYSDGAILKTLFGFSVSNAGDVNNDGYGDIVVGQPGSLDLDGLVTAGKASIFYGNAVLSNKAVDDVSLLSPRNPDILGLIQGNLLFGYSVSGGKDFNCDGISDVLVGEPGGVALGGLAGTNAMGGQAYIYYGKNSNGPVTAVGKEWKEADALVVANLLGVSVSPAGDINGDGNEDIVIGASNGTLNLSNIVTGVINFTMVSSIGSAYVYTGCLANMSTLPVKLIYFKGFAKNNNVELEWQSSSETNFSHFEIERSVNGGSFEQIGIVIGKGETVQDPIYTFIDPHPPIGTNTYRLKMHDNNGTFSYSAVITIQFKKDATIRLRSTMVKDAVAIEFNNAAKGIYKIDLLSMSGQLLQSGKMNVINNNALFEIGLNKNISKGVYLVSVQHENKSVRFTEKIFVQ